MRARTAREVLGAVDAHDERGGPQLDARGTHHVGLDVVVVGLVGGRGFQLLHIHMHAQCCW